MAGILDLIRQERTRRATERAQIAADAQVSVQQRVAEAEQARQQQAAQAAAGQRLEALRPLLGKFDPATAKQLGTAIASPEAASAQFGMATLAGLVGQLDPQYRNQVQQQQQALAAGEAQAAEQAKLAPLREQLLRGQVEGQGLANTGQRLANLQAQATAQAPPTDAQLFEQATGYPLPKDYVAGRNPYTRQLQPMPAPNTEPYRKAQSEVQAAEGVTRAVTRFLSLLDNADMGPTGTEFFGPDAGMLRQAREEVITAYRKAAELGTPTGGELERIEALLPDPTGFWRNMGALAGATVTAGFGANSIKETIAAPYQDMLSSMTMKLDEAYKRNWYISPTPGIAPPQP